MHPGELKLPLSIKHKVMATAEKQPLSTQLTKERSVFIVSSFPLFLSLEELHQPYTSTPSLEPCLKCDGAKRCASHINTQETLSTPPIPASMAEDFSISSARFPHLPSSFPACTGDSTAGCQDKMDKTRHVMCMSPAMFNFSTKDRCVSKNF